MKNVKRLFCLLLALTLVLSLSAAASAEELQIYPQTGTVTVYRAGKDYGNNITVTLASGNQNFTLKRSSVKVTPGETGAKFNRFYKSVNQSEQHSRQGDQPWSKTDYNSCYYRIVLWVERAGTATVKYTIAGVKYTLKIKVLDYVNPVRTITLTGVNGGKNFASLTKPGNGDNMGISRGLPINSTVKSPVLKIKPAVNWKITGVFVQNATKGIDAETSRGSNYWSSLSFRPGTMSKNSNYVIRVYLINEKNGCTQQALYFLLGSGAPKEFWEQR